MKDEKGTAARTSSLFTADLLDALRGGRAGTHGVFARDFVSRWARYLSVSVEIRDDTEPLRFVAYLDGVHLHGVEGMPCLLITSDGTSDVAAVQRLWRQAAGRSRFALVFAMTDAAQKMALEKLPADSAIVFGGQKLSEIMESSAPREVLVKHIRTQICRRQLLPYRILQPICGNMFFGRKDIVDQLVQRPLASFAIAGPGGIGKSSILAQYRYRLRRKRDPRLNRLIFVNFKSVSPMTGDAVERRVAMAVSPSSRTYYDTTLLDDLPRILQQQAARLDGPVDFLLDEVDEVCQTEVFSVLGEAARAEYCRLVLCGRGVLLRLMTSEDSPLRRRLGLLRLEPLPSEVARQLIEHPLHDLGFQVAAGDDSLAELSRLTGRHPHALQFLLNKLTNYCIDREIHVVSRNDINRVSEDFESAQFFTAPLRNIREKDCYRLGLLLLEHMKGEFSVSDVCRLAECHGMRLSQLRAFEMCSDLLISNVLAWNRSGCFHIANGELPRFADRLGLFSDVEPQTDHV